MTGPTIRFIPAAGSPWQVAPDYAAGFAALGIDVHSPHIKNGRGQVNCPCCGDKKRKLGVDVNRGLYHCFKCKFKGKVDANAAQNTRPDPAAIQRQADERAKSDALRRAAAARRSKEIFGHCSQTGEHPYLARKKIGAHGCRFGSDRNGEFLAIPMMGIDGAWRGLQRIYPTLIAGMDTDRLFEVDSAIDGAFYALGELSHAAQIVLTESFANAASAVETDSTITAVCAFSAGNLPAVARALRAEFPDAKITLVADNDIRQLGDKYQINTGVVAARDAAIAVNGKLAIPDFNGKAGDLSDLWLSHGAGAVKACLDTARPVLTVVEATPRFDDEIELGDFESDSFSDEPPPYFDDEIEAGYLESFSDEPPPYFDDEIEAGYLESFSDEPPPRVKLPTKRKLSADLAVLATAPSADLAVKILIRHWNDAPRKMERGTLVAAIMEHCPNAAAKIEFACIGLAAGMKEKAGRSSNCIEAGRPLSQLAGLSSQIKTGCHVIKAPMGTGKTQDILAPIAGRDSNVVAICHRQSLARDLAERLKIPCYLNIRHENAVTTNLSICVNSLINPIFAGALGGCRALLIDEGSQVLRAVLNGGAVKKPGTVYEKLRAMVQNADLVVVVDADINDATLALFREWRDDVTFWRMDKPVDKTIQHGDIKQAWAMIEDAVNSGAKLVIPTDSVKEVEALGSGSLFAGRKVICIHGDNVGSTKVQEALRDINAAAKIYDTIIYSPTLASGLSLTEPGFETVALYFGVISPADFLQMTARNRPAKTITVGFHGHGFHTKPADVAALWQAQLTTKTKSEQIAALHLLPGEDFPNFVWTDYDKKRVANLIQENESRSNCYGHFLELAQDRGYMLARLESTETGSDLRGTARDAATAAHVERVISAPLICDIEADAIRDGAKKRTQENADKLYAHDTRHWLGIADETALTTDDVELFNRGAFIPKAKAFEALTCTEQEALTVDFKERGSGREGSRCSNVQVKRELYRGFLEAAGVNPDTGDGRVTVDSARAAWELWNAQRFLVVGTGCGSLPTQCPPPKIIMAWFGDQLRRIGLGQERIHTRSGDWYRVTGYEKMMQHHLARKRLIRNGATGATAAVSPVQSQWFPTAQAA